MTGNPNSDKQRGFVYKTAFATIICLWMLLFYLFNVITPIAGADSGGNVWYADPNTGIQQIIDNASYGDTVFVKAGSYNEAPIYMREGISLMGVEEDLGSVVINGNPNWAVIGAASHTTIKNLLIRNGRVGIYCFQVDPNGPVSDIVIDHNLVIKNETGIFIGSDNVRVKNCTIVNNEIRGILVFVNPNGPVFHGKENIIAFNGPYGGIAFEFVQRDEPQLELTTFLDLTDICLEYNDIYDDLYHTWLHLDGNEQIPLSLNPFGPGNLSAIPCFVDTDIEDYHLLSYSPCIDRGDPNSDHSLEPLPNGERINLGFYGNTSQAALSMDSDDDGIYDYQEGTGDLDSDGLSDWQDADTAIFPLPWMTENIPVHIQAIGQDSNQIIRIKDANIVLPAGLAFDLPQGTFPFEMINLTVTGLDKGETILVRILFPINSNAWAISKYIALSADSSWESIPFTIDPNGNTISFHIEDGKTGDEDGVQNGVIEHLAGLVIPDYISQKGPETCFLSLLNPVSSNKEDFILFGDYSSKIKGALRNQYGRDLLLYLSSSIILILFMVCPAAKKYNLFMVCSAAKKDNLPKRWFPVLLISILLPFLFSQAMAQIKEDIEITSSPNPVGSGARALGMGGAFIGVADDATAASWNPAGLKHLGKPEISWVGAYSSRNESYRFEKSPEASGEYPLSNWDINYLSVAYPFVSINRIFFLSLNYQHLYDFSKKLSYRWRSFSDAPYLDISYHAVYEQSGGLGALSPALAVDIVTGLTLGLTLNIWSDKLFKNEWIEDYHKDGEGEIDVDRKPVVTHVDILERYTFSGINLNLGILWDISRRFTLGLVYKTPFEADLEYTKTIYRIEKYPNNPSLNQYDYDLQRYKEQLRMPASYGIGLAYEPIPRLVIDLDIYRTEWDDYELKRTDGSRINPITGYYKSGFKVKPTHQIRLGAELALKTEKSVIPAIRGGIFYDPEPAPNNPDDFYGVSFGLGLTFREKRGTTVRRGKEREHFMSIDMAYQYRWGRQVEGEIIQNENSPADVDQHLVYFSVIYYFKGKKGL